MAVVVPSHRIHTIHGGFGGQSYSSGIPSIHSPQASSFSSLPNISYSSSRNRGADLSILAARSAPATGASSSLFTPRIRRASVQVPMSTRRAPPPPPTTIMIPHIGDDPFADGPCGDSEVVIVSLPPPRRSSRLVSSRTEVPSYTPSMTSTVSSISAPRYESSPPPAPDRKAAKLVANVLLNRGCGRPMRRRLPSYGESRPYVKSCLSNMVEVEC